MDTQQQRESGEMGRGEQFLALYSSHQRRLYLYAVTLLPVSVNAEDVLQEANLVLWRKFDQYQPGTNFFAWACRIVRLEVLKYREKHARAAKLFDPDVLDQLASVAVERIGQYDEFHRRALLDCMQRLSPADRELMRQRYADAIPVQAMAAAMNRSPNAVSQSLGRIRRSLFDCINRAVDSDEEGGDR